MPDTPSLAPVLVDGFAVFDRRGVCTHIVANEDRARQLALLAIFGKGTLSPRVERQEQVMCGVYRRATNA